MEPKHIVMSALGIGLGVGMGLGLAGGQTVRTWAAPTPESGVTAEKIGEELIRLVMDGKESKVTFTEFPYYLRTQRPVRSPALRAAQKVKRKGRRGLGWKEERPVPDFGATGAVAKGLFADFVVRLREADCGLREKKDRKVKRKGRRGLGWKEEQPVPNLERSPKACSPISSCGYGRRTAACGKRRIGFHGI
ncbi:hypothetical protein KSP40_PGU014688 [Platanthera guangdongensis]|uniref:Uncharacterized protein n=1 Tax=Platanthera guangdongensis TaxID=2320717 RepID=A0ABR2M148_9ASPA